MLVSWSSLWKIRYRFQCYNFTGMNEITLKAQHNLLRGHSGTLKSLPLHTRGCTVKFLHGSLAVCSISENSVVHSPNNCGEWGQNSSSLLPHHHRQLRLKTHSRFLPSKRHFFSHHCRLSACSRWETPTCKSHGLDLLHM